jgi:uncharacterized membrane protein HdeD (DUF308 family)
MRGRDVHHRGTLLFSLLMVVIGVALIVQVIGGDGGGALSARLLLGVLFLAAGVGRTYVELRRSRGA